MAFKHGHACGLNTTREYHTWQAMKDRCLNPNNSGFQGYGGRGIIVCERWRQSFENFLSDMGSCPVGLTLERKNNNGNYEPGNCKWATRKEQSSNTRWNRQITFNGQTKTLSQWSRLLGISCEGLYLRLKRGWTVERALCSKPRMYPRLMASKRHVTS
jgi:hypothetical protein